MTDRQNSRRPIPVTILTGFLGAGKTTLLNNILNAEHGLKVAVLVNDFGSVNIDSQLVVSVGEDENTIELSNGCICCTIRGDLLAALVKLIRRADPPEYILIEASGVSDPLEIAMTFRNPELQAMITVDGVITVVDAEQVRDLEKQNEVMAVLQIGAADIILLNKVDLVSPQELETVRAWIRSIIANARIIETTFGRVPLPMILGVGAFDSERLMQHQTSEVHVHDEGVDHDHEHHDHALMFSTWSWASDQPLSLKAVERVIKNLPPEIFRAKGFLFLADDPDHVGVLQVVGKRANVSINEAWGTRPPRSQVVVIGAHGAVDPAALTRQFDACLAINAPKSELQRLTNSVFEWLRRSRGG